MSRIVVAGPGYGASIRRKTAVSGNWWVVSGKTCVAAYQPKGAASLAASYINLANPGTYTATPVVFAPTWNATDGWMFGGGQRVTTGVVVTAYTWSVIIRFTNAQTTKILFGSLSDPQFHFYASFSSECYYRSGAERRSTGYTSGIMAMADRECYKNGASDGTMGAAAAITPTNPIIIGSDGANFGTSYVQAFAVYSDTLSAGEVSTLYTRMAAL